MLTELLLACSQYLGGNFVRNLLENRKEPVFTNHKVCSKLNTEKAGKGVCARIFGQEHFLTGMPERRGGKGK